MQLFTCTLPSYCTDCFSAVVFTERLTIFECLCKHLYMERGSGDHVINRDISPLRDLDHHLEIHAEPFYAPATSSLLTLTEHLQYRNLRGGIGKKKSRQRPPPFPNLSSVASSWTSSASGLAAILKLKRPGKPRPQTRKPCPFHLLQE